MTRGEEASPMHTGSHGKIRLSEALPAVLGLGAGLLAFGVILLITGAAVAFGLAIIVIYAGIVGELLYAEIKSGIGEGLAAPSETVERPIVGERGIGFPIGIFLSSEAFVFGAAFAAYFALRAQTAVWPPPGTPPLETFIPSVQTGALILSSVMIEWGLSSIRKGDERGLKVGVLVTAFLGILFLSLQLYEYPRLGFSPADGVFGSTFFTLTGFHGAHVFGGIVALLFVSVRALLGQFTVRNHGAVEATATYWHFVHIVWIVLFATLWR